MKRDGKKTLINTKTSLRTPLALKRRTSAAHHKRLILGRYIVADSAICHGKPTFRGTRIMVWQVLEMVSEGMAWQSIVEEFGGSIPKDAVAEAVQLASKSFIKHAREHALEPISA
ncbi:MAG: DUF433 domain-containing protein [Chloroflexota bacterium]